MGKEVYSEQEYKKVLLGIAKDKEIDKKSMIEKLHALIDTDVSMAKCPNISNEKLHSEMQSLISAFKKFIASEDPSLSQEDYDINERNLAEVITRKFKRKEYFKYFHNMDNLSELKEIALLCFWLIKLKPFTVLKEASPLRVSANEKFSLNLILSAIKYLLDEKGDEFNPPDSSFIQDIIYTFKYRDMSKEAMMMLVDSIAYSYEISIDTWKK